jgi:hypothetical protein
MKAIMRGTPVFFFLAVFRVLFVDGVSEWFNWVIIPYFFIFSCIFLYYLVFFYSFLYGYCLANFRYG